jgi:hypothetical protein
MIEVGFVDDGVFRLVDPGSACAVVDAPQGGFWVMPTVRITNAEREATIRCSLDDLTAGRRLGEAEAVRSLDDLGDDGWWQRAFFIYLTAVATIGDFRALDGHEGRLACTVSYSFASADYAADVILETQERAAEASRQAD